MQNVNIRKTQQKEMQCHIDGWNAASWYLGMATFRHCHKETRQPSLAISGRPAILTKNKWEVSSKSGLLSPRKQTHSKLWDVREQSRPCSQKEVAEMVYL